VSAREAVLADMKGLQAEPPDAVVGYVNQWGTGGALVVQAAGGVRLAFKDQVGPAHEGIEGVAISPDGRRVAYAAREKGQVRVLLDGKAGAAFERVGEPLFSRDSRHLVYRAQAEGRYHLVIDERRGPPLAGIDGEPFLLARREEVVVVERATEGARQEVVAYTFTMQRRVLAGLDGATELHPSDDGSRLVAVEGDSGARRVVTLTFGDAVQRVESEAFEEVTGLAFDPTSAHLMWVGSIGGQAFAVLDGTKEPVPTIDIVARPAFDPARKSFTYAHVRGEEVHLATAFGGTVPPGPAYSSVEELVRSPDGRHLAFAGGRRTEGGEEYFVVVDGVEATERWDRVVSPRFSPDGRFLAYRARKDGQRFLVIADGSGRMIRRLPSFEQVFPPAFTPDGKSVGYAVKDGSKLAWRVEPL
jgi:hypothetical protein